MQKMDEILQCNMANISYTISSMELKQSYYWRKYFYRQKTISVYLPVKQQQQKCKSGSCTGKVFLWLVHEGRLGEGCKKYLLKEVHEIMPILGDILWL